MPESGFHFAQPLWLLALLAIPAVLLWLRLSAPYREHGLEERYADARLLPYLSGSAITHRVASKRPLLLWVLAWTLATLAMAGPRWDFRQMSPFEPGADLVVLLDISRSMDVADVNPSRLERARQEIQDLVRDNPGISIGLVAFATIAHVVTPITEDGESIVRQLPALSSQLVQLQGSRVSAAIERAAALLEGQRDKDVAHNILLISDGDFTETGLDAQVHALYEKGIRFHVLGVGSDQGGPVPGLATRGREPVMSWLNEDRLKELAQAGGGVYRVADFRDDDTRAILDAILSHARKRQNEKMQTLVWNEYFYWPLAAAILILLYLFRPAAGLRRASAGEVA
ncbi:MAG TPA: VWA domain-containing protein [Gammaproteobacteria bacterium]|nr:VWA domain-containing protein [Gammaproteobacteria bacterium]